MLSVSLWGFSLFRRRAGHCLLHAVFEWSLEGRSEREWPRANLNNALSVTTDSHLNSSRSPPGTGPEPRRASPSTRSCSRYWRYELKYFRISPVSSLTNKYCHGIRYSVGDKSLSSYRFLFFFYVLSIN